MVGCLYSKYKTNISEVINAGRHERICTKGNSHTTEDVMLAKYSSRTMIKSGCKGRSYDFFTKLEHKRSTSVTKIAGNCNTVANNIGEKRATN